MHGDTAISQYKFKLKNATLGNRRENYRTKPKFGGQLRQFKDYSRFSRTTHEIPGFAGHVQTLNQPAQATQ